MREGRAADEEVLEERKRIGAGNRAEGLAGKGRGKQWIGGQQELFVC